MDPYNLAICFGPTLMSVPEGHDQVSCQAHVNELIKTIIIQHENIFPGARELEGPVYSRGGNTEDYWYDGCSEESHGWVFIHGLGCCSCVLANSGLQHLAQPFKNLFYSSRDGSGLSGVISLKEISWYKVAIQLSKLAHLS